MSENKYYYLDENHNILVSDDISILGTVYKSHGRIVGQDHIGDYFVSTVFLAIDHRYIGEVPPILFETMVFPDGGNSIEDYLERYCTWQEAELGHKKAVELYTLKTSKPAETFTS